MNWNCNGFRARLKDGGFQQMLDENDPDVLFLNEFKAKPLSLDRPWEFRRALAAKGYHWCTFNYSVAKNAQTGLENCGNWGTAMFSKIRPLSVTCGLNQDNNDVEGRVMTVTFRNAVVVNVYVPCTQMHTKDVDAKRVNFEEGLALLM